MPAPPTSVAQRLAASTASTHAADPVFGAAGSGVVRVPGEDAHAAPFVPDPAVTYDLYVDGSCTKPELGVTRPTWVSGWLGASPGPGGAGWCLFRAGHGNAELMQGFGSC
jgi:hypothetical protein